MNKRLSDGDGGSGQPTFGAPSGLGSGGGFGAGNPGGFGAALTFGSAPPAAAAAKPAAPAGGGGGAPDLNSTGLLPKIKAALGDEKYKLFVGIVKQFKSGAIPLQQVNGQVGLMCAASPDLHGEFQKWSTQWAAAQGQGAPAPAPAPAAPIAAPAPLSVQPSSLGAASSFGAAASANAGPLTPIMEGTSPAVAAGSAQKDKPAWPAASPSGKKRETSSFGATAGSSESSSGREASSLGGGFNKPLAAPSTAGGFGGLGLSVGSTTTTVISNGSAAAQGLAGHAASAANAAANAGGPDLVWARNHSPCSIVCVVAGFLPDEIVERALKQLLVLVRDAPNVGLLIIDVSQRSEWAQGNLKPSGVDFLNKFNKDRRENVRVCIMDASTDGSSAVPGVNIESLPATMVFQGGKLAGCGVVHGFTREKTKEIEASVRQCTSKGGVAAPSSSATTGGFGVGPTGSGPKDLTKTGPSEPLSIPASINLCHATVENIFKAAHARCSGLDSHIQAGKQAGSGVKATLTQQLDAAKVDAEKLLQEVGELRFEKGSSRASGSRLKRVHDQGRSTSSLVSSAEQLLDVCAAQTSIQGYLYADIAASKVALDPKADWIVRDMAILRSTAHDGGVSPKKVSPLAKTVRAASPASRPKASDSLYDESAPTRQALFSKTVTSSDTRRAVLSPNPSQSQSHSRTSGDSPAMSRRSGARSTIKDVLNLVRNLKVSTKQGNQ